MLTDPVLSGALAGLYAAPAGGADPLVRDERLTAAVTAMTRRGATSAPPAAVRTPTDRARRQAAHRARELLDEAFLEPLSAERPARAAGCSRFALYRRSAPSTVWRPATTGASSCRAGRGPCCGRGVRRPPRASPTRPAGRWFQQVHGVTPGAFRRA
ncbi:hypothetical protein IPZ68_00035 [Streptomyces arenae]|nr:hypothetical protein [Streptomyces arenae]